MYNAHVCTIGFSVRRYVIRKRNTIDKIYEFNLCSSCESFALKDKKAMKK